MPKLSRARKAKEKAEDAKRKLERATLNDNTKTPRLEKAHKAKEEADKELAKKLAEESAKRQRLGKCEDRV